jgi:hypothetical protein
MHRFFFLVCIICPSTRLEKKNRVINLFVSSFLFLFGWLFIYCFTPHSRIFHLPLPVKGCKIEAYARRLGPLSREESLSCHTYCDTGHRFFRSAQFSRLLWHAMGCGGPILTQVLTDPLIVYSRKSNIQLSGCCDHYRWQGCKFRPTLSTFSF